MVRAPLAGKCPRTEVGNSFWRAAGRAEDNVLSPAHLSGPIRAVSPSSQEHGQGSPNRVVANVGGAPVFS